MNKEMFAQEQRIGQGFYPLLQMIWPT